MSDEAALMKHARKHGNDNYYFEESYQIKCRDLSRNTAAF